jgi:glycosyltransferase involved in cell wall biosynthesis
VFYFFFNIILASSVFLVEPFSCSSHSYLISWLSKELSKHEDINVSVLSLPGKKWHWRLRASSCWAAQNIPQIQSRTTVFFSSMINIAEVIGLRPDLNKDNVRLLLYMHENQLAYPVRQQNVSTPVSKERDESRDFAFGWAQLVSMLTVNTIIWNSNYNRESFLDCLPSFLKTIPDKAQRPDAEWIEREIRAKSCVLYLPIPEDIHSVGRPLSSTSSKRLRIAWPHRHEYDKNPELFFDTLRALHMNGANFEVVLLGESFGEEPIIFAESKVWLEGLGKVAHWGYAPNRATYLDILSTCDVAVSTAAHEFFGVAMLEAAALGVTPLAPAALAYPEIFAPTKEEEDSFFSESLPEKLKILVEKRLRNSWLSAASTVGRDDASQSLNGELECSTSILKKSKHGQSSGRGAITAQASRMISESSFRNSPYLYASQRDLLERLEGLARNPSLRSRVWQPDDKVDLGRVDGLNPGKRSREAFMSDPKKFSKDFLLQRYESLLLHH